MNKTNTPLLFPYDPDQFWQQFRQIIREEIFRSETNKNVSNIMETPGLHNKPLFKLAEVCEIFQVSKPTIYTWIKLGKLKPFKIRSRVYFLSQDVLLLMNGELNS